VCSSDLAIVVLAVVFGVVWFLVQQRRRRHETEELRELFGPEYDRTVDNYGEQKEAERELAARQERVQQLRIRPLSETQSSRYARQWREVQARFVDDPEQAIADGDRLVVEVMQTRGYPMVEFEQRAADVSVDHPHVVDHYRAAHDIAGRSARGETDTEDLRQAMVHYRALFEDLIDARTTTMTEVRKEHAA